MSAAPHSPYPDIVERLRLRADGKDTFSQHHGHGFQSLCKDAAAEIEHLAADIAVKARLLTAQTKEIERLTAHAQRPANPNAVKMYAEANAAANRRIAELEAREWSAAQGAQDAADAARYRHLKEHRSYYYHEGHNPPSPREFGIEWHWQDSTPERADMDTLIDREIEEKRVLYAIDEEEGSQLPSTGGP